MVFIKHGAPGSLVRTAMTKTWIYTPATHLLAEEAVMGSKALMQHRRQQCVGGRCGWNEGISPVAGIVANPETISVHLGLVLKFPV